MVKGMSRAERSLTEAPGQGPVFVTTRWSVVLDAGDDQAPQAQEALACLCRTYWYPIYHFIRRQGHSMHDAQDLTQEFFSRLLEKNWVARADQSRGRFRSFLLMVLKRFLAGEWRRANAQKRAGARRALPFPLNDAETRYVQEPADDSTPDQAFEKQWVLTLLDTVVNQLRADYEQDDKARLFDALKPCLTGPSDHQPYATLAADLGMSEGAVKVAVHRLRERYRERLRLEIAQTVASASEVESELRHLFRVLARG